MKLRLTRRLGAITVAMVVAVAIGATALAGHLEDSVKSYTGCLAPNDGVIVKVKEGTAPKSPCTGTQTQVHLSVVDIPPTSVTGALTGGGENGEVTIGLKAEFTLPTGCSSGQIAKWNGTAWACAADENRIYEPGTGLELVSLTLFRVDPDYRVKNTPDCPSGQFATGFNGDGEIQCATPSSANAVQVFVGPQSPESGIGIPNDSAFHDVVSLNVPAGTYSITAIGNGSQFDQRDWLLDCFLQAGSTTLSQAQVAATTEEVGGGIAEARSMAMASIRTFTGATTLKVACRTDEPGVGAEHFVIQATKFG
jgi:hypothetical protein